MKHSIQPFLSEILDYAGLYPPSSLSLNNAFHKYIQHTQSDYSWMLSKFVTGTNNLRDLQELVLSHDQAPQPFLITAVAAPSESLESFKNVIDSTKAIILDVVQSSTKEIKVPSLEIKLPETLFKNSDSQSILEAIEYVVDQLNTSEHLPHHMFFEISGFTFDPNYSTLLVNALHQHSKNRDDSTQPSNSISGYKIRCGGVESFQFPPTEYLAKAISESAKSKVPLKFTAGLHHAVRHYNDSVSTKMHGFLNVFGATLLAHNTDLETADIQTLLEDENADHFLFTDKHFSWMDNSISLEEINILRSLYVTSFGSCSFEEPIEDLQELNLLT